MRKLDFEEFKRIEEYVRRKEEEYRRRVEEEERRRREAIQFLLENSFILGKAETDDELAEIMNHKDRIEQIRRLRGINFRVFVWDDKVVAIPSEVKASFSITMDEILRHARRFGESLAFFEEVEG